MTAPTVPEMKALGSSSPKSEDTHRAAEGAVVGRHRWSGWPGAWCLDCGADDPHEAALADGRIDTDGERTWFASPEAEAEIAAAMVCLTPGAKTHDPYAARRQAAASAVEQVGIGPLADEPKIVPAPTEKGDGVVLSADDHAVISRCAHNLPKLYRRGQHAGYYQHSDVADLIDIIGRLNAMIAATQQATGEGAAPIDHHVARQAAALLREQGRHTMADSIEALATSGPPVSREAVARIILAHVSGNDPDELIHHPWQKSWDAPTMPRWEQFSAAADAILALTGETSRE